MGEEEKKPAEDKKPAEEVKKEEVPTAPAEEPKEGGETKEGKAEPAPPPDIVLRVYMHCEGCARKVRKCLRGFQGVEDVITDCKSSKVVVKGEKADPLKVLERVQKKSHRKVDLLSPIPKPPAEEEKKVEEKEKPKPEEKKPEPEVITVVLKVYMHCEACAQEIKKRIVRMKGVESAEPDLKGSQVTVKGAFEAEKLVEYVYKRTGKHASVVKQEPEKKKEETEKPNDANKEEKKTDDGGEKDKKESGAEHGSDETAKKEDGAATAEAKPAPAEESAAPPVTDSSAAAVEETTKVVELRRNEYHYYPPRYPMELYAPPPQIFSDENPNACTVM